MQTRQAAVLGGRVKILVILNDAPYGLERTYNGLRLAGSLSRQDGVEVKVFFIGDAAGSARIGQTVPSGYYNVERMVSAVVRHGGTVGVCGTCLDARGIRETDLIPGTHRSSMDELTIWAMEADKVITF
jgi:uncharacterized protein involved in oxidation of intracellular sulfur